ncbi:MAG: hypothetical protein WC841_04135 [Candidatus Shapirobacteria bacterium]
MSRFTVLKVFCFFAAVGLIAFGSVENVGRTIKFAFEKFNR